jgi:hypothetical protein
MTTEFDESPSMRGRYHMTVRGQMVWGVTWDDADEAWRYARRHYGHRADLTHQDVRIEERGGILHCHAGPCR